MWLVAPVVLLFLVYGTATALDSGDEAQKSYQAGKKLFEKGDIPGSITNLEHAVRLQPRNPTFLTSLGVAFAAASQYEMAEPFFARACAVNPAEDNACYYHGRALYALNRFEPALVSLEKALPHDRRPSRVQLAIAQSLEALGQAVQAEEHFHASVKSYEGQGPPDSDPRIHYGVFLYRQGRTEDALRVFRETVAAVPDSARARMELGRTLLHLGRAREAAKELAKAVGLDPKYAQAHLLLGKAYYQLGDPKRGEQHSRLAGQQTENSR